MRRRLAAVLAGWTVAGCPRVPDSVPDAAPAVDATPPDAAPVPVDTGLAGCPFVWDPATALPLPPASRAFELEAACVDGSLVAAWRADGTVSAARRDLAPDAPWRPLPDAVTTDATALGDVMASDGAAWLTWQSAGGWLRVARLDPTRTRASGPLALVGVTLSDPHVLYAADETALLGATARSREGSWAMVLRLGILASPPLSGYILGGGTLAAAAGGSHALVAWTTTAPGRPAVLHGARVDTVRAMALDAPTAFQPLPRDVVLTAGETDLGAGRFTVAPAAAPLAGAVLYSTSTGTDPGDARVAWFPPGGGATVAVLSVTPRTLAGLVDDTTPGQIAVTYWDGDNTLRALTATPTGATVPQGVALPLRAEVEASLGTREVLCGGRAWRVMALRSGGTARLYAQPAACLQR